MSKPDKPLNLADVSATSSEVLALKTILIGIVAMRAIGPVHGNQTKGHTIMLADQVLALDPGDVIVLDKMAAQITASTGELLEAFDAGTPEGRGRMAAAFLALLVDTASEADVTAYFASLGTTIPGLIPKAAPGSKPLMVQYIGDVLVGIRTATKMIGRQD